MSAGLSGMAEGSAEFFYRAHFRAQRNSSLCATEFFVHI